MKDNQCPIHKLIPIPCIEKNFQGCISPHPNPGVHVFKMCPKCWEEWQEKKRVSPYRW
jgi:hypothetical protein